MLLERLINAQPRGQPQHRTHRRPAPAGAVQWSCKAVKACTHLSRSPCVWLHSNLPCSGAWKAMSEFWHAVSFVGGVMGWLSSTLLKLMVSGSV